LTIDHDDTPNSKQRALLCLCCGRRFVLQYTSAQETAPAFTARTPAYRR
jgi:hypothetical protein